MLVPIPGAETYLASTDGFIYSTVNNRGRALAAPRLLRGSKGSQPYLLVWIGWSTPNGSRLGVEIHRLILMTFRGIPQPGRSVSRHLDGDPLNNCVDNLAWGTHAENAADRVRHGRGWDRIGSKNPNYRHGRYVGRGIARTLERLTEQGGTEK